MENQMTAQSLALFLDFAADAPNWNNQPLVDITAEQRGNLTDLKKRNLITTFRDEGCDWVIFTQAGIELAAKHGFDLGE